MNRMGGILLGAALVVGLVVGHLMGKRAGHSEAEEELESRGLSWSAIGNDFELNNARKRRVVSSLGESLNAPAKPSARVGELGQTGDPIERLEGILALAASLRADEFEDTVKAFIHVGTWETQKTELGILLQAWAKLDPDAAVEFIDGRGLPDDVKAPVLTAWAKSSPEEAIAWARKNYQGNWTNPANKLLMGVINGLAESDPERATALIGELPKGEPMRDALRSVVMEMMEGGLDSAIQWSDSIVDNDVNTEAVKLILRNVAAHDPERAAELMMEMGGSRGAATAADRIAYAFAQSNVDRAIGWSQELTGEAQSNAARGVVMALSREDPQRASEYLESMEGGANLNFAITSFVWGASNTDPALAADWIAKVADPPKQQKLYRHILARWLHDDREAARQWIDSNDTMPEGMLSGIYPK